MARKKKEIIYDGTNEYLSPNILCYYELEFKKDIIKPGEIIKFKGERGSFKFYKWAHNSEKDVQWIDCLEIGTGRYRSFYIHDLKGVLRPKKSRRKKHDVTD